MTTFTKIARPKHSTSGTFDAGKFDAAKFEAAGVSLNKVALKSNTLTKVART